MIFFFTGDQSNLISGNFLSLYFHPEYTFLYSFRFMDLNMIICIPESSFNRKISEFCRQAWIYFQSIVFWLNTKKRLRKIHKSPCCCSGEPAVFGFTKSWCICSGDHLGIHIWFCFMPCTATDLFIFFSIFYEHSCNKHRFCHRSFRWTSGLERLSRFTGETVQIQTVIPVSSSNKRQSMWSQMCHCKLERAMQMFH